MTYLPLAILGVVVVAVVVIDVVRSHVREKQRQRDAMERLRQIATENQPRFARMGLHVFVDEEQRRLVIMSQKETQ